jgi:hypothetical protein
VTFWVAFLHHKESSEDHSFSMYKSGKDIHSYFVSQSTQSIIVKIGVIVGCYFVASYVGGRPLF